MAHKVTLSIQSLRDVAETFMFFATGIAALLALLTYRRSVRLERAKWLMELYNKFYEHDDLKQIRDLLDAQDQAEVLKLVREEPAPFTDYLNFFELLGYLCKSGQLNKADILEMFEYYLRRMEENPPVVAYINDPTKGFERLKELFDAVTICRFLFVYGTLMKGFDSLQEWQRRAGAKRVGTGRISGKLYDLGEYPGAIPTDHHSQHYVAGEVYELQNPELTFGILDDYEEYFPLQPESSSFVRTLVPVKMEGSRVLNAWVYFYKGGSVDERKLISSGDYRSSRSV